MKKKQANTTVKNSSSSKDMKLPKIGKANPKSKSPTEVGKKGNKSNSKSPSKNKSMTKGKSNNNIKILKTSGNADNINSMSLKMEEANEKRKKRLQQEKKEEARDKKVYEQVLKEFQEKNKSRTNTEVNARKRLTSPKNKNDDLNNIQLPKIRISEKKTQAILEEGGMLDAYKYLIVQLCKNGLPTGNLFEYSAYVIRNYEKKWKEKKSKMNKEKLEQYWKEKKEQVQKFETQKKKSTFVNNKKNKEEETKIKALNRSLEQREINKLISNMDRSRSSRNHQNFPMTKNKSEEKLPLVNDKSKVTVAQKETKSTKSKNTKKGAANKSKSPTSAKSAGKSSGKSPASAKKTSNIKKKK